MSADFKKDLDFGEKREQEFCERQRGWQRAETKNSSFDLISNGATAEIKSEKYVTSKESPGTVTKNACVEFQNTKQNKPSGLFAEDLSSVYWIHQFNDDFEAVFYTKELRKFIEETKSNYRVHYEANSASYIVPASAVKHLRLVKIEFNGVTKWISKDLASQIESEIEAMK